MKNRIVYFDFLSGLAILMVIAIHTFSIVDLTSDSNLEIFLRQILNCAVPIFLAISGFFISKGNKVGTYWAFLKHQIPRQLRRLPAPIAAVSISTALKRSTGSL